MKRLIILLSILVSLVLPLTLTSPVLAVDPIGQSCEQVQGADATEICKENQANQEAFKNGSNPLFGPDSVLTTVVNMLSLITAVIAVIVIMIGGTKLIVGGDDSNSVASARRTIIYAVISLIIVGSAQLLVRVILSHVKI